MTVLKVETDITMHSIEKCHFIMISVSPSNCYYYILSVPSMTTYITERNSEVDYKSIDLKNTIKYQYSKEKHLFVNF